MAITYVGKGAFGSGSAAVSGAIPAGCVAGDLMLLFVESANQAIAAPAGWTEAPSSPQFTGTAAAAGGVRLGVFYRYHSGSEAAVSVADTGDHTTCIVLAFRGVNPNNPFNATAGSTQAATTAMVWPGVTTTVANTMIVLACAQDTDAASTTTSGTPTNANLGSLTEQHDQTVATGVGGGLVILTGTKATAGATGTTTSTGSTAVTHAYVTLALQEPAVEFPSNWMPRWAYTDRAFNWTVEHYGAPTSWTITSGSLPPGLSLNASSGAITGTATTPGSYTFTIQASDGVTSDTLTHTIRVRASGLCDYLQVIRFVGTGAAGRSVPTNGLDLSTGGMVWLIPDTTDTRALIMSANGSTVSDGNLSEFLHTPQTGRVTFANGSFTLPADLNVRGRGYTAFVFAKAAGFLDVVAYTGTGAVQIVPHAAGGGSVALALVHAAGINKGVYGYHGNMGVANKFAVTDGGLNADANGWQQISGTQFTVKALAAHNTLGENYVAAVVAGGAAIVQTGSVTGNASIGGPIVNSGGVVPRMIVYGGNDNVVANGNRIYALDMQPGLSWDAVADTGRYVRNTIPDYSTFNSFDLTSNQLQVRTTDQFHNGSADTYRYVVFADDVLDNTVDGALAVTLAGATVAATGTVASTGAVGTLAVTLENVDGSGSGAVRVAGTGSSTLGNATAAGAGAVAVTGQGASTLAAATVAAVGTVAGGSTGYFGDNTPGADTFPNSGNRTLVSRAVLAEAASVVKIWAHFDSTTTAGTNVKGLIYAESAGEPSALQVVSSAAAIPAGGGWVEMAASGNLAAGTYWIGVVTDSFTSKITQDLVASLQGMKRAEGTVPYASPVNWPGTSQTYDSRLSVYVEYTTGAPGPIAGTLAATLANATAAGTGRVAIAGATTRTLDGVTANAQGAIRVTGSAAAPLAATTATAQGRVAVAGTGAGTLANATAAAQGEVDVVGTGGATLATTTLAATAQLRVAGVGAGTLADAIGQGTARADVRGSGAGTLDAAAALGAGQVRVTGAMSAVLGGATLVALATLGDVPSGGTLAATLADATVVSTGTVQVRGQAAPMLESIGVTATGGVRITAVGAASLAGASLVAFGGLVQVGPVLQVAVRPDTWADGAVIRPRGSAAITARRSDTAIQTAREGAAEPDTTERARTGAIAAYR